MEKDVRRFFGYLHNVKKRTLSSIGLYSFSDIEAVFDYLEYLSNGGASNTEIKKQATLAVKITNFMKNLSNSRGDTSSAARFTKAITTLEYVGKEVSAMLRREKGSQTK
jgi:hypothetical protein